MSPRARHEEINQIYVDCEGDLSDERVRIREELGEWLSDAV
jgi:hypothetical protein